MGYPKKVIPTINLKPEKILLQRREELLSYITEDGTYLPKQLLHPELDRGFLDFVKDDLKTVVSGKIIPMVDLIITTQNWAQFTETWDVQDLNGNPTLPFITVVRQPEVKYGSNPALLWNIPNRKQFYYAAVPTWNGNIKGMDIYKIPQPVPVDITYNVKIVCNRMRELNEFNKNVIQTFASRQAYTKIEGHYIPIIMNNISDESVVEIQRRRFYIQNYEFTMLGFLLDPDEFEVSPAVSRVFNSFEVVGNIPPPKRRRFPQNPSSFEYTLNFGESETTKDILADYTGNFSLLGNTNINNDNGYEVYIKPQGAADFDFYGTNVSLIQVNTNDTLRFIITKTNAGQVASLQYQIVLEPPAIPFV
jgi:hypothetical protein